ncbi:MAG: hypothetical protein WDO19_12525 [Bacteroidota bacterium]
MKVSEALDKSLFWDVNPEKLDWEKNKQFIIERVFVRGGMKPVVEIFRKYSLQEIINAVKKSRDLDPVTHNFCSNYFNIPKEQMYAPSQYY